MYSMLKYFISDNKLVKKLEFEFFIIAVLLTTWTLVFHFAEWRSFFHWFYFSVITLATIGLGDIVPHTLIGQIMTMIYAVLGAPIFLYTTSIVITSINSNISKSFESKVVKEVKDEIIKDIKDIKNEVVKTTKKHLKSISESKSNKKISPKSAKIKNNVQKK